jgi:hypothetical protein
VSRFRFIDVERASYPVNLLCRLLKVSRSGFLRLGDPATVETGLGR